jgi:rhodanese-related sulfurtransferase
MNKNLLYLLLFIVAAGLYFLYLKGYIFADFKNVTPKEAYEMIRKEPDVAILDVRTPEEYARGHLEGARLVPVQRIDRALGEGALEDLEGKKIVVYCRSGVRSVMASRKLAAHGFKPYNVRGGIKKWSSEGLPLVK